MANINSNTAYHCHPYRTVERLPRDVSIYSFLRWEGEEVVAADCSERQCAAYLVTIVDSETVAAALVFLEKTVSLHYPSSRYEAPFFLLLFSSRRNPRLQYSPFYS